MNSSGQAFSVYRLLIGAIVALLMLVIVYSAINYFEGLKFRMCDSNLQGALISASNTPDGSVVVVEECAMGAGKVINARELSLLLGVPEECFTFESSRSSAFEVGPDEKFIEVRQFVSPSVYVSCDQLPTAPFPGSQNYCEFDCTVSLGKPL